MYSAARKKIFVKNWHATYIRMPTSCQGDVQITKLIIMSKKSDASDF